MTSMHVAMKWRTALTILAAGMLLTVASTTVNAASRPTVIAYIDVDQAFEKLTEKDDIQIYRQRESDKREAEIDRRKTEISELEKDLSVLLENSPLRMEKEDEIFGKTAELQAYMNISLRRISREVGLRLNLVRNKMLDAIGAVAKANGVDLVLNKQGLINLPTSQPGQSASATVYIVMWSSDELDVTDSVVQRLNNEYRNRPGN